MIPKNIAEVMKDGNAMNNIMNQAMQNVPEQLSTFMKQNDTIIELLNEHTKALVSVYAAIEEIAKKDKIKLPKPLTEMKIQ